MPSDDSVATPPVRPRAGVGPSALALGLALAWSPCAGAAETPGATDGAPPDPAIAAEAAPTTADGIAPAPADAMPSAPGDAIGPAPPDAIGPTATDAMPSAAGGDPPAPVGAAPAAEAAPAAPAAEPPPAAAAPAAARPIAAQPSAADAVAPRALPSPLALTFALGGDLVRVDTDSQWGGTLRLGLEWSSDAIRVHASGAWVYSAYDARSVGVDGMLGLHYRFTEWLHGGLVGSVGVGSSGVFDPWLERSWTLGLELGECLRITETGRLCFEQRFAPLGGLTRRAALVDGELYRLPLETDGLMRAEVAVGFRQEL